MAEDVDDPREVAWHPRLAQRLVGHRAAVAAFREAMDSGRPHHAWLLCGPKGVGKATFAYAMARDILGHRNSEQSDRWIAARAHPGLFVLERGFTESKPKRLRQEISVDDARKLTDFFSRTASDDGWRVALVDCADDLSNEAANALLKLVEEPPPKCLILLVCNRPGVVLRTLRSRCRRVPFERLPDAEVREVLAGLPLEKPLPSDEIERLLPLCQGAPGAALDLAESNGAKAFEAFKALPRISTEGKTAISKLFAQRQQAVEDYPVFAGLLLDWLAREAAADAGSDRGAALAEAHAAVAAHVRTVEGYNLDRRVAVMQALSTIEDALKAA
ncbi:MAG: DNA polymerase III subunit delta' [Hyphomicrobiales bacterium]